MATNQAVRAPVQNYVHIFGTISEVEKKLQEQFDPDVTIGEDAAEGCKFALFTYDLSTNGFFGSLNVLQEDSQESIESAKESNIQEIKRAKKAVRRAKNRSRK